MPGPGSRPDGGGSTGGGGKKHHKKHNGGGGGDGSSGGGGNGDGGGSGGSGGGGSNYNAGSYSSRVHYAYSWLVNQGLSPNAAAGVVGNLVAESSVDPNANQSGGPGMGIAQWSEGGRWEALKAWAGGRNIYSLDTQLGFLWHELQTGYRGVLAQLQSTHNMAEATQVFMTQFEMPADVSASAIQGRVQLAENVRSGHNPNMNTSGGAGGGGGGGMSGQDGGGGMGPKDQLTDAEMAERYGWAMSFLKSQPELWDLFQKAVKHDWSPQQFAAKLRDTKWFQQNSETVRKNQLLKTTDPATYADRLHEIKASLADMAAQMGAQISDNQLQRVANNALMFGWSDSQIQNTLADYVQRIKGSFQGTAGDNEDQLRAYAHDMGVRVSPGYIKNSVQAMASGQLDLNGAKDHLMRMSMSAFPALADDIKAGKTVADLASPFVQSMSSILELNPESIDLFHPMIRNALSTKNGDGKPDMKTIWQFEQDLREDPRWLKTTNARDALMGAGRQVMTDFGLGF